MKKFYIISAVGRDRPGLVNEVTHAVNELDGNVELQRSTRMASEFALLILFSIKNGDSSVISERIEAIRRDDFFVTVREALSDASQRPDDARHFELIASGADQPGLLDAVTHLLMQGGINIEAMDYDVHGAPMSGEPMFRMHASLAVPREFDISSIRRELRELEDEYNFDIIFRDEQPPAQL